MNTRCYQCGTDQNLTKLFDYVICNDCQNKLRLFADETIMRYVQEHNEAKKQDAKHPTFEEEMIRRLGVLEKETISKQIKLLYILDRIKELA